MFDSTASYPHVLSSCSRSREAPMCSKCILNADKSFNHNVSCAAPLWKRICCHFERGTMGNPGSQTELVCLKRSDNAVKIGGQGIAASRQCHVNVKGILSHPLDRSEPEKSRRACPPSHRLTQTRACLRFDRQVRTRGQ